MKKFMLGIVVAIVASYIYPELGVKGGPLHSELFIKKIGVSVIFLCSGMKLDPSQVNKATLNWKAHVFCQGFTMFVTPIAVSLVLSAIKPSLEPYLADSRFVFDAIMTRACLPPPVSSARMAPRVAVRRRGAGISARRTAW